MPKAPTRPARTSRRRARSRRPGRRVGSGGWRSSSPPRRVRTRDLAAWPQGDGHPVIVLPGFLAGPESTVFLRSHLRRLGYRAHDWRQGRNLGASPRARRPARGPPARDPRPLRAHG